MQTSGVIEAHVHFFVMIVVLSLLAHPWRWALIDGAFVTAAAIASIAAWRLNESVHARGSSPPVPPSTR